MDLAPKNLDFSALPNGVPNGVENALFQSYKLLKSQKLKWNSQKILFVFLKEIYLQFNEFDFK